MKAEESALQSRAEKEIRPVELAPLGEILRRELPGLGLSGDCVPQLETFARLLLEKNQVMNLTAITQPEEVAVLHFLDSLALSTFLPLEGKRVVDVGTGAGFPGMPLKIALPGMELVLLDSLGKRVRFLQDCCEALGLEGVSCVHARAEDYAAQKREGFDLALSRAVAALPLLAELCLPLVKPGGLFVAMKAVDSEEEIQQAKRALGILGGRIREIRDYALPGVTHRAVLVEKVRPTPAGYPRPFARMKKAPL